MPHAANGRLVLAVDITHWLRPDAPTSADRLFCHVYGRVAGPRTSLCRAGPTRSSLPWNRAGPRGEPDPGCPAVGPAEDVAEATAAQVRRVVEGLIDMGRWHVGDSDILVVFDAGYDALRRAHLLKGLPVEDLGRMRTDRVMRKPVPVPSISPPEGGRPPKHHKEFAVLARRHGVIRMLRRCRSRTATGLSARWPGTAPTPG